MNIRKVILLFVLLLSQLCGISSAQSQSVMMSQEDLLTLEQTCELSEMALRQSLTELEAAKELLTESEQELTNLLQELSDSQELCDELRQELAKLKVESAKLKSELSLLKVSSTKASSDLMKAEKSLQDTEAAYKKERKKQVRQTRLWQVIAVILGGVAIAK